MPLRASISMERIGKENGRLEVAVTLHIYWRQTIQRRETDRAIISTALFVDFDSNHYLLRTAQNNTFIPDTTRKTLSPAHATRNITPHLTALAVLVFARRRSLEKDRGGSKRPVMEGMNTTEQDGIIGVTMERMDGRTDHGGDVRWRNNSPANTRTPRRQPQLPQFSRATLASRVFSFPSLYYPFPYVIFFLLTLIPFSQCFVSITKDI